MVSSADMETSPVYRLPARVQWHANGGFTRLECLEGRMHNEIPTDLIPPDLRAIGSCFILVIRNVNAKDFRSAQELRGLLDEVYSVERL